MAKKQLAKSSNVPVGVMILSILAYIGAIFTLIAGFAMIFGASFISTMIAKAMPMGGLLAGSMIMFFGVIFIALAVLDYFIGKGLWNGQNWARILVLIFSVLSLIGALTSFSVLSIVLDGIIIWYLGFNKEAVAYFN